MNRTPEPDADICIIGAGPAGALVADRLAGNGHDVVVLDAGKRFTDESRTLRMERSLRPPHSELEVWDMDEERDAYTSSGEVTYPVNTKRSKGIGGSTLHWGGRVARFTERDFEMDTRYGLAEDWPISYADLKPYYAEAETELGVAGATDNPFASPRDEPYPMDEFPRSYSDSLFAEACEEVGVTMHSVPNARNSRAYEGRPPCVGYGTCSPVCPSGAKYSADVHIDEAESKGARIIDRAVVRRLETDGSGSRITGAMYETPDRTTHTQTADQFLLAAGAIENARLLLLSSSPEHPDGLANSSGAVGKYLMEHPYVGIVGQFDVETSVNRIGFGTSESYQFYEPDDPPPGAFKIEFSNSTSPSLPELALEQKDPLVHLINAARGDRAAAADLRSDTGPIEWGDELLERLKGSYGNSFRIVAEIEVLPNADNRVTLNPDETDTFGDPVPDVSWGSFTEYAESAMDRAFEVLEEILSAVDAEVVSSSRFEHRQGVGHNSGTTRMGTDPETSVVDRNHRSHDVQNLFIAGASTFVTLGAGQPTLTIAATSLRLADYLDRDVL